MSSTPPLCWDPSSRAAKIAHIVDGIDESAGCTSVHPAPVPLLGGERDSSGMNEGASRYFVDDTGKSVDFEGAGCTIPAEGGGVPALDPDPVLPWGPNRGVPSFFHGHRSYRQIVDQWCRSLDRHRREGKVSQQVAEWLIEYQLRLSYGTNPLTAQPKTKSKPADGQLHFGDGASTQPLS